MRGACGGGRVSPGCGGACRFKAWGHGGDVCRWQCVPSVLASQCSMLCLQPSVLPAIRGQCIRNIDPLSLFLPPSLSFTVAVAPSRLGHASRLVAPPVYAPHPSPAPPPLQRLLKRLFAALECRIFVTAGNHARWRDVCLPSSSARPPLPSQTILFLFIKLVSLYVSLANIPLRPSPSRSFHGDLSAETDGSPRVPLLECTLPSSTEGRSRRAEAGWPPATPFISSSAA